MTYQNFTLKNFSFQVTLYVAFWALLGVKALPSNPAPYHGSTTPTPYNYEYGVNSPHHGSVFSQKETRDNYNTAGEYRVNLPDGRVQIVSYSAGPHGYVADVKYEGEPVYPEHKPREYHTPNTYKPVSISAPTYAPAPTYTLAPKALQSPIYHQTAPIKEAPTPIEDEAFDAAEEAPAAERGYRYTPYYPQGYRTYPYHHAPAPAPAPYKPRTKYTYKTIKEAPTVTEAAPIIEAPAPSNVEVNSAYKLPLDAVKKPAPKYLDDYMPTPGRFHPASRPAPIPYRPVLPTYHNLATIYRNLAMKHPYHSNTYQSRYYSYKPDEILGHPTYEVKEVLSSTDEVLPYTEEVLAYTEEVLPPTDVEVIEASDAIEDSEPSIDEGEVLEVRREPRRIEEFPEPNLISIRSKGEPVPLKDIGIPVEKNDAIILEEIFDKSIDEVIINEETISKIKDKSSRKARGFSIPKNFEEKEEPITADTVKEPPEERFLYFKQLF